MINSFNSYLKIGRVKRMTPDPEESKALLRKAVKRLEYTKSKDISDDNAQFIFEDAYESAREAAQALMSVKGFKPYSHEATISFVKETHPSHFGGEDVNDFNQFRQMRNDSAYKAIIITKEDAKRCLRFAERFIGKAKRILSNT